MEMKGLGEVMYFIFFYIYLIKWIPYEANEDGEGVEIRGSIIPLFVYFGQ